MDAEADDALAKALLEEIIRHGGKLPANRIPMVRPDLRKKLGDGRLLQFVKRFPDLLEVRCFANGGHMIYCKEELLLTSGVRSTELESFEPVGRAPEGATLSGYKGVLPNPKAAHAIRQLQRELLRRMAPRPTEAEVTPRLSRQVALSWLLHDGRIRRRIGAVVLFQPVPELIICEPGPAPEDDDAEALEPGKRFRCPLSAHARTYAGYLIQFVRDRPHRFLLQEMPQAADQRRCIYESKGCTCRLQAIVLKANEDDKCSDEEGNAEEEELMLLIARKVQEICKASGSKNVLLTRVGREKQVQQLLGGRSLLHQLERDVDRRAERGLPARIALISSGATLTVSVRGDWAKHSEDEDESRLNQREPRQRENSKLPTRPRRMDAPTTVNLLAEAPGLAVLSKRARVTTEAELEALQALYNTFTDSSRRVISVSRLDKDTSGVLVTATSQEGADCLTTQFKEHKVFKRYLALCVGKVEPTEGEVIARLYISGFAEKYRAYVSPKGKEAHTLFEVLQYFQRPCENCKQVSQTTVKGQPGSDVSLHETDELASLMGSFCNSHSKSSPTTTDVEWFTLLACYPLTGRTHQIRAHLEFRGHPLVSDPHYNPRGKAREQFTWCPRLWLHCHRMQVNDLQGRRHHFSAPLPDDLIEVLQTKLKPEAAADVVPWERQSEFERKVEAMT